MNLLLVLAWGQLCVTGRVVDAGSGLPIVGAAVSAALVRARSERVETTRGTTTDSTGHYRLCLSSNSSVLVQATTGTATAYVAIVAPSVDSTLGDLRMPAAGDTGTAIVAGHVVSERGAPVEGATVTLLGGHVEIPTGSDGSFGLRGPAGAQVLIVRRIGLGAAVVAVDMTADQPKLVNVTMQHVPPTLAVVNVVADRLRLAPVYAAIGFTARQRLGHGHFLTAEDIDRKHESDTPELFRGMPGVRVRLDHNNVLHVYSDRGVSTLESYGDCTAYFVDGRLLGNGRAVYTVDQSDTPNGPEDETQLPPPGDLIAVEVYQANEPAPVPSGVVDRCLKVLLWTKAMIGRQ